MKTLLRPFIVRALAIAVFGMVSGIPPALAGNDGHCKPERSGLERLEKCAEEIQNAVRNTPEIKSCSDPSFSLYTVPVGFRCHTSKGAIYQRVALENFGLAWKGPDGLTWSDYIGRNNQFQAVKTCIKLGGSLPTKLEFQDNEDLGFREVLPDMGTHWYWSSTAGKEPSPTAYRFNSDGMWVNARDCENFLISLFTKAPKFPVKCGYSLSIQWRTSFQSIRCVAREKKKEFDDGQPPKPIALANTDAECDSYSSPDRASLNDRLWCRHPGLPRTRSNLPPPKNHRATR